MVVYSVAKADLIVSYPDKLTHVFNEDNGYIHSDKEDGILQW